MRSLNKWHRGYLFWVGFGALEGAFLKHASTVFLDSSVAPFNLFRCAESGVIEASNLLDWLLSLGWVYLSWWSDSAEHMRKWMTNNAKRVTKAPWLVFMAMCSWEAKKRERVKRWKPQADSEEDFFQGGLQCMLVTKVCARAWENICNI